MSTNPASSNATRRFPRWLLPLIAILFMAACLLLAEILLRSISPLQIQRDRYFASTVFYQYNPEWVRHDSLLGFSNKPSKKVRIVRPDKGGFAMEIRTNSQGYRDDEESLRNPRVLFLGDSFGFGWGVSQNETCEAVFERQTGLPCLNLAASGYGTLQQYLQLRQYAETHDIRGRIVVLLFYPNDWLEITGSVADVYPVLVTPKRNADSLVTSTVSREDFDRFIAESHARLLRGLPLHSEILRRFWQARQNRMPRPRKRPFLPEYAPIMQAPHHPAPQMLAGMDRIARSMSSLARKKDFHVLFVHIPPMLIYEGERCEDARFLKEILDRHGIPLLDLQAQLRKEDYWLLDRHWNAAGHAKAAKAIADCLRELGWLVD